MELLILVAATLLGAVLVSAATRARRQPGTPKQDERAAGTQSHDGSGGYCSLPGDLDSGTHADADCGGGSDGGGGGGGDGGGD